MIFKFFIIFSFLFTPLLVGQSKDVQVPFLNSEEEMWLREHQRDLRIGITQIPNQVLQSQHGYRGYAIDIFTKIASLLDIDFQYVYYNTWQELLNAGAKHEIDIVFFAQKTPKRMAVYNFSDVVLIQHNKIITTSKNHLDLDVGSLFGKKVAVVNKSAIYDYIQKNFPQIEIVATKSETDSLMRLSQKEVDYTIAEPVRMSYYINKNNIDGLYIAGDFPYEYRLRIASRNDIPVLNMILNKAIAQIPIEEKKALALKWGYEKDVFFDKVLLWKIFFFVSFIIAVAFYLFSLNRKLQKAKKSLSELNANLEKRVMEELEKNREKELMMLNQARLAQMGQVLNMVAHQWRQPLNNLMLLNQTLLLKYKKEQGCIKRSDMDEFKKNSTKLIEQMSKTIDDFRDFFKPKRSMELFSLNEMIEQLLNIVNPLFANLKIRLKYDAAGRVCIKGYPNEFAQALLNILYNAKDALREKEIAKPCIEIFLEKKGDRAAVYIKDNAGGIPQELIEKIFDPYFSTKEEKNGTGLGLYMSKLIIQKHPGADIYAYNEQEGAVFKIEFKQELQKC